MSDCRCPNCGILIGNSSGESAIYGSHDVSDLCEPCFLEEDAIIEKEGTNSPEDSVVIKNLLLHYRQTMRNS